MTNSPRQHQSAYSLHTLGPVALASTDSVKVETLRKKDFALLIYLCVEGPRSHSRVTLSGLLWGDHTEARARHSLTQAIGRVRRALPANVLLVRSDHVEWLGPLDCDACDLERAYLATDRAASDIRYDGDFLHDFRPGLGADEFDLWAEQRRSRYRSMALHVLESCGAEAEARRDWLDALEFGRRSVEIESLYEEGHRRIMRSWSAQGERGLALRHYNDLAIWLETEHGLQPDPSTSRLAAGLSHEVGDEESRGAHTAAGPAAPHGIRAPHGPVDANRITGSPGNGSHLSEAGTFMRFWRAVRKRTARWGGMANGRRTGPYVLAVASLLELLRAVSSRCGIL